MTRRLRRLCRTAVSLEGAGEGPAEYGFVPEYLSAQSPQPGAQVKPAGTFQCGPVTWRQKVVFYDKSYDSVWIFHPETVARYLGANGFQVLEAAPFAEWMKKTTREGAYGTVCVMTQGLGPVSVYDQDNVMESPIRKYLQAGGRVVWLGEMPFLYIQDEVHPFSSGAGPDEILGIRYTGDKGAPMVSTLGKTWGLSEAAGPAIVTYSEDVTAPLSGFHSDYADDELIPDWFKNFNPLYPWSGFIMCYRANDMAKPALQESVYRLALYTGQPVKAPAGIKMTAQETPLLKVVLDPPRDRHCYYRGETIPVNLEANGKTPAGGMTLVLERDGNQYGSTDGSLPTYGNPVQARLATADLACGDYLFRVLQNGSDRKTSLWEATVSLCPRHEDPTFFFGTGGWTSNPYRQEKLLKDLASCGMQNGCVTTDTSGILMDLTMKYGLRFCLRAHGVANLTPKESEEAERRGTNNEKLAGAWEGGRPISGLVSTKLRETTAADMAMQVKELASWPGAWLRCQTNDDFALKYGWDYSDLARRTFKEKTGLDAPVPPELAKQGLSVWGGPGAIAHAPGIIPDNDPWLQWNIFTTRDVGGGYNKALTDACAASVPGIKVGPVPGSMMFPLWEPGQYPPHDFGPGGFNLIYYYMYLNYWQPTIANLYWNEVGRINNRDLELWAEPDCGGQNEMTYTRNTFFLQMAGGAQGFSYYIISTSGIDWETLGKIGKTIVKPLYPFLGKLRPSRTSVGLLLPYTQFCYNVYYAVGAVYPFANLLGAHVDVQPTCEEEVLSGDAARYKVILLWRVQYLRQSVVTALEDYIARGGVVICDATSQVPIKGAIKTSVDLAMGDGKSNPDPNDPRLGGPGITDYLHPDRVALVRKTLDPYVQPWADCDDPTLIARRHEYHGVTYLWLVNIQSQKDYEYIRPRTYGLSEPLELANPEKAKKEKFQYLAELAGQRFTPLVTIPAGNWAAYDVLKGKRVLLKKEGNRLVFTADMERLGGTLIALYPEPIARVVCSISGRFARGQEKTLRVTVTGPHGKPVPGTQPLAVTVLTSKGEWDEITGAHATEDGVWSATVHPAINDPAGTWKIRVKELSSGITGETSFKVN